MELPAEKIPPLLPRPDANAPGANVSPSAGRLSEAAFLLCAIGCALVIARLTEGFDLPILRCSFKTMTGLPCAFCGGTRSFRALTRLDLAAAFFWNPLVVIATFALVLAAILRLTLPRPVTERWLQALRRLPWVKVAIALVALNWIYLIVYLPR
jgi:hypothetical protein